MTQHPRAHLARLPRLARWAALLLVPLLFVSACVGDGDADASGGPGGGSGGDGDESVLVIGGIPDQDVSQLERQFGLVADYLAEATGLAVEYVPANDYAAVVSGFQRGDIHLAWFGGLTGVQARAQVPDAEAIAQRVRDAEFRSVFIVGEGVEAESLADLEGQAFTFGSESSTSGHLMPRFFLLEEGIDADRDLDGVPGFSGSHDRTYELVESGAFQAGALNEAVWEAAVAEGRVDTSKVRVLLRTPAYYDYNWTIRPDVDEQFGEGTAAAITRALLDLAEADGEAAAEILETFGGGAPDGFIETSNEHYESIREIAEQIGIIQ